jgi:dihydrofolate reductase
MNVFLIAALTTDGFIAQKKEQSSLSWTSKADKTRFVELTKRAGVMIMGRTTFETIGKPLKDRRMIVYTSRPLNVEGVETTQEDPAKLLQKLEQEGFKEVAICGGSQIYTLFAKNKLINALYLTIEPITFGNGIPLFSEDVILPLELAAMQKIDNTLLLDYIVKK